MAAAVGKYAANKFLKKQMAQYKHKDVESDYVSAARSGSLWYRQLIGRFR
jgi:hypothetical protein